MEPSFQALSEPQREALAAEIVSLLEGPNPHARRSALQAFQALPQQQRVPHAARIVSLLDRPSADVRRAALQAFEALPPQQREPHAARIVALLKDPDADVQGAALRAIQALPEQEGVPHAARIASLLEDPGADVRRAALQTFHALPEQQRVLHAARVVSLIEDPSFSVRMAALQAFQALPQQQRVPHAARIVSLLYRPSADVRRAALQAFEALPPQQREPHAARIISLLKDPVEHVQKAALHALPELLNSSDAAVRAAAVRAVAAALRVTGIRLVRSQVDQIVSLLEDPDADVRVAALQAIQALLEQQRVPHATRIVSLLESPDAGVRQEAYRAIQSVGPLSDVVRARHIAIAVSQLDDPDAGVHRAVLGALASLSEEERVGHAAALIKYCWRQLETLQPSSRRFSVKDEVLHQAGWPLIKGLGNNSLSSQFPPCADWPVGLCSSVASAFVSGRLDLSKLGHSSLPSAILPPSCPDHFMSLRKLDLSGNGLTHLPDVMWQLISLEQINLSQNKLSELSARITKMPRLTRLDAADNPLQMPPIGVVSRGIASVKAYFEELEQFGGGLSRQLKLVVLGDGEAGKTSIVRGLKSCTPKPARADERTVQLDISQLRVGSGASAVTLDVWDLGGQQRYAAVQQAFLVGGVSCRGACASCRGALRRGAWSVARLSRCSCPWRSGAARSLACGQTSARSHIARATGACPCR